MSLTSLYPIIPFVFTLSPKPLKNNIHLLCISADFFSLTQSLLGVKLFCIEGSSVLLEYIFEDARMCLENESGDCRRKKFRVNIGEWCPRALTFCAVLGNLFKIQILMSEFLFLWLLDSLSYLLNAPEINGNCFECGNYYTIWRILRNRPLFSHTVPFKLVDVFDLTVSVLLLSS